MIWETLGMYDRFVVTREDSDWFAAFRVECVSGYESRRTCNVAQTQEVCNPPSRPLSRFFRNRLGFTLLLRTLRNNPLGF